METTDVLKIQNKLIESLEKSESLCKLKLFNDELIEKLEFEKFHPFVFSERLTRLLVKYGFVYNGHQHCKSYRSYDIHDERNIKHCRVYFGDNIGEIIFMYKIFTTEEFDKKYHKLDHQLQREIAKEN